MKKKIESLSFDSTQNLSNIIIEIENFMLLHELDIIYINFNKVIDYEQTVLSGFMPKLLMKQTDSTVQYDIKAITAHFIEKLSINEQKLWYFETTMADIISSSWSGYKNFVYANLNGWRNFTAKSAISFPLILYFPDQLYSSKRPITDMSIFRQVTSPTYHPKSLYNENKYIHSLTTNDNVKTNVIPVTRYAKGMSKGLFFGDAKDIFCGIFYYYEPESTTYLAYNTIKIYRNKFDAILDLDPTFQLSPFWIKILEEDLTLSNNIFNKWYKHPETLPEDLKMTILEYMPDIYEELIPDDEDSQSDDKIFTDENGKTYDEAIASLPKTKRYVGKESNLYAAEDIFDQALCHAANKKGIDIIILTHMIGSFQIVTEILDTRKRQESFSSLCYPLHI